MQSYMVGTAHGTHLIQFRRGPNGVEKEHNFAHEWWRFVKGSWPHDVDAGVVSWVTLEATHGLSADTNVYTPATVETHHIDVDRPACFPQG